MPLAARNTPEEGDALLVIDVQCDFLAGGSLAVRAGDAVIAPLNGWIARFAAERLPVFATRDWHPADHCSFASQGGSWPAHCVAGTSGARFPAALALSASTRVISKATRQDVEAYSGFAGTDLHQQLQSCCVRRFFIGGLTTDYCVLNTLQDGLRLGYEVILLTGCIRPVDVRPGDGERAIAVMMAAGATALSDLEY
jgi:nicotinamidase/pyrazinamidase